MLICCVKTGDKYTEQHVQWLKTGLERNISQPFEFVCITDQPMVKVVSCRTIKAEFPGWWAKLQCFSLGEPLLFFDLDVVLTANLQPLLEWDGFGIIKDWQGMHQEAFDQTLENDLDMTKRTVKVTPMFNSSVMKLTGHEGHVWEEFISKPEAVMSRFVRGGDQRWITARMTDAQTFPGAWFSSLKLNGCWDAAPDGALAVIAHGDPKPWAPDAPQWMKDYLRDLQQGEV